MSNAVFPTLAGLDIKVKRTPVWSTEVLTTESGKEQRAAWWSTPRYRFNLGFNYLRQGLNGNEAKTLVDFFHQHRGQFESFLFSDPYESAVTAKLFGTGTGSVAAYQLVDGAGYPVTEVNGTPTIYRTDWQGTYQLFSTPRANIAIHSQNIAAWAPVNATATSNATVGPDGTTDAGTLVENTANASHYVSRTSITFADNTNYCMSIWAKRSVGTRNLFFYLYDKAANQRGANFDLGTGTVSSLAGAPSAGVIAYPNGWYRLWLNFNSGVGANPPGPTCMLLNGAVTTYLGDGASSVGLFGLTVEEGSAPTPYIPTTTVPVTVTDYSINSAGLVTLASTTNPVGAQNLGTASGSSATFAVVTPNGSTPTVQNVWRTDWQGRQRMFSTARTNAALRSGELGDAAWTATSMTVQNDMTTAPNGSALAEKLTPAAASSAPRILQSITSITAGQVFTESIYIKAAGYNKVCLREGSTTGAFAAFDLSAGTILATGSGGTGAITSLPNGWYRLSLTSVAGASSRLDLHVLSAAYTTGDPTVSWTGDGTSAIYGWGAQVEVGAVATSYIPTTTVAVTVTDWSQSASNVVFSSNPLAGAVIEADYSYVGGLGVGETLTWTGSYYRRVRFDMDEMDMERIFGATAAGGGQTWEGKTVKLISVK